MSETVAAAAAADEEKLKEKPKKQKKKRKRMKPLPRFLLKLVIIGAIVAITFTFVLGVHIHHGNGMYPFIMDGDLVITYKLDAYREGDCVVYDNPISGEKAVSRIVAVGSNEIMVEDNGQLLINNYVPAEQVFYPTKPLSGSDIDFPYQMTPNGYFLLDDYREIGVDSRAFGEVSEDALQGKIVYVLRRRGI